jgi:murein DD-endopeptidase MepM/ murein hydrolase activator NlpD
MNRKAWALILAMLFCGTFLCSDSSAWAGPPQHLKKKLSSVKQKKNQLKNKIKSVKGKVKRVKGDIREVDGRINVLDEKLETTANKLSQSREEHKSLQERLKVLDKRLADRKAIAMKRMRAMYKHGDAEMLSLVVGSESFADYASRRSLLERISKCDRDLFLELRNIHTEVSTKKDRKEKLIVEIKGLENQQKGEQGELKEVMKEKKELLTDLQKEQRALTRELDELEAQSRAIEAQIAAYQSANPGDVKAFKGRFLLPVHGRFSSGFGMRYHPILHKSRMHTGQDIAAGSGTPILAAAPGRVISAGYRNGYGNTVVLDHGGGISTLYGHCSRLFVSSGQRIQQGQKIAAVGSTGLSTGPHLHFEVRVKGKPVNPRKWI